MGLKCDVCGSEIPSGATFCPRCHLEVVQERERSGAAPLPADVFDWSEGPEDAGRPKIYSVQHGTQPAIDRDELRSQIQQAHQRLMDGHVREAAGLLRKLRPVVPPAGKLRAVFDQMTQMVDRRKQAMRQQALDLAHEGQTEHLVGLLARRAATEMDPEEICAIAIEAARYRFESGDAEGAKVLLRLYPFKTLRATELVDQRQQLEALIYRRRNWQESIRNVTVLGVVSVLGSIGLVVWAWFVWQSGLGQMRGLAVPGMLGSAILLLYLPRLLPYLVQRLRAYLEEKNIARRIAELWKGRKSGDS